MANWRDRQPIGTFGGSEGENELTIENRTSEETQELKEQVLLLSYDFVPSSLLSAGFNLVAVETTLHIGVQPVSGRLEANAGLVTTAALEPALLLLLGRVLIFLLSNGASITVGGNVSNERVIFVALFLTIVDWVGKLGFGIPGLEITVACHGERG